MIASETVVTEVVSMDNSFSRKQTHHDSFPITNKHANLAMLIDYATMRTPPQSARSSTKVAVAELMNM
ncbi:hypothetical protein Enr13x_74360 [Stieleria neptunia]|uniref:Uncharacterized protein n=1 Tax=Stieleria neptunia TaxID=2527979 RepID=A0A518I386_9BACT|nr:hypothetical protein Enr13x_74360 [Stieleria neptunia]